MFLLFYRLKALVSTGGRSVQAACDWYVYTVQLTYSTNITRQGNVCYTALCCTSLSNKDECFWTLHTTECKSYICVVYIVVIWSQRLELIWYHIVLIDFSFNLISL